MSKLALFLALSSIVFLTSCKVSKQINKTETSQEIEAKVDSAATVKNDITKDINVLTEIIEEVDTTLLIKGGSIVVEANPIMERSYNLHSPYDSLGKKWYRINLPDHKVVIKKKKTIKTNSRIKETDQSKVKVEVKRESKKEDTKNETVKDIEKTNLFPWYWWIILLVLVAGYMAWRFRKFLPFGMFFRK